MKVNWSLTADQTEVDALRSMLNRCGPAPPPRRAPPLPHRPRAAAFGTTQCAPGSPDDASNVNDEWVELVNGGSAAALAGGKIHDEGRTSPTRSRASPSELAAA